MKFGSLLVSYLALTNLANVASLGVIRAPDDEQYDIILKLLNNVHTPISARCSLYKTAEQKLYRWRKSGHDVNAGKETYCFYFLI